MFKGHKGTLTLNTSAAVSLPLKKALCFSLVTDWTHAAAVAVNAGANSAGGSNIMYTHRVYSVGHTTYSAACKTWSATQRSCGADGALVFLGGALVIPWDFGVESVVSYLLATLVCVEICCISRMNWDAVYLRTVTCFRFETHTHTHTHTYWI